MQEKLYPNFTGNGENFALRIAGRLALERVSQEDVFNAIASFYDPEYDNFSIEFWDATQHCWITVV